MTEPLIEILMSVYNGGAFLAPQLDSLLAQSYQNWRLLVRDDGSTDESVLVVREYCEKHPDKFRLVADTSERLGACQSFARLLESSTAGYLMFSDQDDVWLPSKVCVSMEELLRLERQTPRRPILVYTDLTVVDHDLAVLAESFWQYQRLNPRNNSLNSLILDNIATGCTMIFNQQLRDVALPIPEQALMHDWWLALVASVCGHLGFVRERTILYRQHGRNDIGAADYRLGYRLRRFSKGPVAALGRYINMSLRVRDQARSLLDHLETVSTPNSELLAPLRRYVNSAGLLERKYCLARYNMLSGNYIRWVKKVLFA